MRKLNIVAVVAILTLCVGCATFFGTVVTMTEVVRSGMTQWGSMSKRGLTSKGVDAQVIAAHDQYRGACAVAQAALVTYKATGNQADYVQALATARVAAVGVIDLIAPLLKPNEGAKLLKQLEKARGL